MIGFGLIDVAPGPVGLGVVFLVIVFVLGFVILLVGASVLFLWYRKRSMRGVEMIRPDNPLTATQSTQLDNPNQP